MKSVIQKIKNIFRRGVPRYATETKKPWNTVEIFIKGGGAYLKTLRYWNLDLSSWFFEYLCIAK